MSCMVLGNGASGTDIALDISSRARKVYMCARKWDKGFDFSKSFGAKPNITLCTNISHCPAEGTVKLEVNKFLIYYEVRIICFRIVLS